MRSSRSAVLVLLVVIVLIVAPVSPAAAAPPTPETLTLTCAGGTCRLAGQATGLPGLLREGANMALTQLPFKITGDGGVQATLDVKRDISLSLPVGEVKLTNASLQVELDKDGRIARLNGAADMPFPTFGLLDDVRVVTAARANVGLDLGKNLPHTGFVLDPDRTYLFLRADTSAARQDRSPDEADQLAFSPGQRAILVVDTVEPVAYFDGQVTMSGMEQIALLGGLLETTPVAQYVPDTLPLRQRVQFGVAGKFSKDLAESRLTLRGAYLLDAGMLPAQLGIEAQLLSVLGELTISRDGALVNGVLRSAIEPDKLLEGGARVTAFLPFRREAGPGRAGVDAGVKVPVVDLGLAAGAEAGAGRYELNGELDTPFTDPDVSGRVSGKLPDVAGAVRSAAGVAGTTITRAGGSLKTAADGASDVVVPAAGRVVMAVRGYVHAGVSAAGNALSAGRAKLGAAPPSSIAATP